LGFSGGGVAGMAGGGVVGMAGGGTVPGYAPGRDTVPAVLARGEGVLVPEAVRALGGPGWIYAANAAATNRPSQTRMRSDYAGADMFQGFKPADEPRGPEFPDDGFPFP